MRAPTGHSGAGRSIIEMITEQVELKYAAFKGMDDWSAEEVVEALGPDAAGDDFDEEEAAEGIMKYWQTKGELNAIAYCLAKLRNPAKPNVNEIKKEIHERWEASK